MANHNDEAIAGIKNSQRWLLLMRGLPPEQQQALRSTQTIVDFTTLCNKLQISDPLEVWQAKQDYLRYGRVPLPEDDSPKETPAEEGGGGGHHYGQPKEKEVSYDEFHRQAREDAETKATEWNKTKDPTKAMSYFHAYGQAEQDAWDNFVKKNPAIAQEWAKKHVHPNLTRAIKREESVDEAKKKKLPEPDFSWNKDSEKTLRKDELLRKFGRGESVAVSVSTTSGSIPSEPPPEPSSPEQPEQYSQTQTNRFARKAKARTPLRPPSAAPGKDLKKAKKATSFLRLSPITLSFISVISMVTFLTFLFGGIVFGGIGGLPSDTTTEPSPIVEPGPPPPCDQIDSVLLSSFGITITGDSAGCRAKEIAFTTYSTLFQSEKYANLVRNAGGTTITMTEGACKGRASGDNFRVGDCSNSSLPYFFVHEMGHVVGSNSSIDSAFKTALPTFVNSDSDGDCYDGNFLKTYLLRTGVTARSESFAEAITLYYLGKRTKGVGAPITNFKTECPATYALIKDIVFGGYEFNGSSVPPGETGGENTGQQVTVQVRKGLITTTYRSANTCGGEYDLSNTHKFPIGNFGDPNCNFSKDALNDLIRRLDPGRFCGKSGKCYDRLDVWNGIIRCESGYRPNAINRQIGRTGGSGWGAWGLFQMNPDFAGRAPHDNGTVEWRTQVENAIKRNNSTGGGFRYWSCARGFRRGTK